MTLDDLSNLDPNDIGRWPLLLRSTIIVVVCVLVAGGIWYVHISKQLASLETIKQEEITLKEDLVAKQRKAANLQALEEQLIEMKQSFGDMVRQLPDQTEVASLIVDISQTGLATGLEFELFKPGQEKPAEFYSELPIAIRVIGNYHQMGEFVSGIAQLPRIVTTHDIKIQHNANPEDGPLIIEAIAKTYRALDDEEI